MAEIAEQEKTHGQMIEALRRLVEEDRSKRWKLQDLNNKADSHISAIHTKFIELEPRPSSGGKDERWHLTRPKDFAPSVFNGKDEEWVRWKEEIEDYMEAVHPGGKELLREVARTK